jgi:uncharacterized membrane protein
MGRGSSRLAGPRGRAMIGLTLAALFLVASHFLVASTALRSELVRRLGEARYLAFYSALTLLAFAWLIAAYLGAPTLVLWTPAPWAAAMLLPVALVGAVLVTAGLSTPNPVIVHQAHLFDQVNIVGGILRVSRNPFFWGAGLLSLTQVIVLGDIAGLLAFGSIAVLGIIGSFVLDAKKARRHEGAWNAFAAATSNVPFLAIIRGRQRLSIGEIGPLRLASGLGLFLIMLAFNAVYFDAGLFANVRLAFR